MNGYYTTNEVAQLLGISRVAVFKKIKKGQIRATKFGRNYLIRRQDIGDSFHQPLSSAQKQLIYQAVKRSVQEYGEALQLLGKE